MAIANNIGHDDLRRDTPHRENLPDIANAFIEWDAHGTIPDIYRENADSDELLGCPMQVFIVPESDLNQNRLDAFYYAPQLRSLQTRLRERAANGEIQLMQGANFELIPPLTTEEKQALRGHVKDYVEINSVTRDGLIVAPLRAVVENLPTRADLAVQPNDVLFAKNARSRGTAILVPSWFTNGLATSGFIGIRPKDGEEALILWSVFRSEVWRTQTYYLAITASQSEVRDEIFKEEMLIPWPAMEDQRDALIGSAQEILRAREAEKTAIEMNGVE